MAIVITLEQVAIDIARIRDGSVRLCRFTDPATGITVQIPFDDEGWAAFMRAGSGIVVANGVPPVPPTVQ